MITRNCPPTPSGVHANTTSVERRRVSPSDCLCIYFCTVCEVCVRSGSFKHCSKKKRKRHHFTGQMRNAQEPLPGEGSCTGSHGTVARSRRSRGRAEPGTAHDRARRSANGVACGSRPRGDEGRKHETNASKRQNVTGGERLRISRIRDASGAARVSVEGRCFWHSTWRHCDCLFLISVSLCASAGPCSHRGCHGVAGRGSTHRINVRQTCVKYGKVMQRHTGDSILGQTDAKHQASQTQLSLA